MNIAEQLRVMELAEKATEGLYEVNGRLKDQAHEHRAGCFVAVIRGEVNYCFHNKERALAVASLAAASAMLVPYLIKELQQTKTDLVDSKALVGALRCFLNEAGKGQEDLGGIQEARGQLESRIAELEEANRAHNALHLQSAKDALVKYDVCFEELMATRAQLQMAKAALLEAKTAKETNDASKG